MKKTISLLIGLIALLAAVSPSPAQETTHTVQPGDTLWDISSTYLKTPWSWPLIWSRNQDITNPHLIYPGDKVVIRREGGKTTITIVPAQEPPTAQAPDQEEVLYSPAEVRREKEHSIVVSPEYSSLIYTAAPLTGDGKVLGIQGEGLFATTLDEVILKGGLVSGQRIAIASQVHAVKKGSAVAGHLYKVVALADVTQTDDQSSKARITYANREVQTGDIIFEDPASIRPVTLTITEPSLEGRGQIIDLFGGIYGASAFDLVFIDMGTRQGVGKGALLDIHKEFKVVAQEIKTSDYQGLALVLQSLEESSMALILDSKGPIEKGFTITGQP